jgi:transposase InsO family protein
VHRVLTRYHLARLAHLDRATGRANLGYQYLHNAVDDHSRLAYTEILADQTRQSAAGFWTRAYAFFTAQAINVKRVLTDNGSCYRSHLWPDTLTNAEITHKRTRPRPAADQRESIEWAYATAYRSETERRQALPSWLHSYNHADTPHSTAYHPPAAYLTCRVSTASRRSGLRASCGGRGRPRPGSVRCRSWRTGR